ncbi:hypothetical protein ASPCAL10382 [Aspergillus calidoustus]|uniref:Uncharacterized protein n=1 Tax=Aspergillus calidoustus TaxID=454130 RepID=A0A0U5G6G2_ASPCI|nr:hypothetical protein ASPCAL10382 [Aspergillus calidoustus]
MAKSARRSAKGKSPAASPLSSSGSSTPSSQSGPLPPFTVAPDTLRPILPLLSNDEVYLVHIDTSALELKKQTFIIPAITNAAIAAILAYRIYTGRTLYPALLATVIGISNPLTVDASALSWPQLVSLIVRRTFPVILDYFLFATFIPWLFNFYRGPIQWRRSVGFQNHEIIVRRSQPALSKPLQRNRWIRENDEMRDKIVAAVTPDRLNKTGYLLVDADWALDYPAMIKAHALVTPPSQKDSTPALPLDEFRTAVLVNTDTDGWLIWRVGDEDTPEGRTRTKQRDQIIAFKDKLSDMGHEDLFFRWVELIQYESTRPGGFTAERQQAAMVQAKALFEEAGVDFATFWAEVGGMEGFGDTEGEGEADWGVDQLD